MDKYDPVLSVLFKYYDCGNDDIEYKIGVNNEHK